MHTSRAANDSLQQSASESSTSHSARRSGTVAGRLLPALILVAGFVARLIPASRFFLNPDEALHYFLSDQPTLGLAYRAALTNSHPPLLILLLYYWRLLGPSELTLRLLSILAGTACCWLIYRWLGLVADRSTSLVGLLMASFTPAMIDLSWELRQYALLMFFGAGCLYLGDRALRQNSPRFMILYSLSLYGALLVHYSSLLFAFVLGLYMLVRFYPYRTRPRLLVVWAAGQIGGIVIGGYYFFAHMRHLRQSGMVRGEFETYLYKSIFHAGQTGVVRFVLLQTLRLFTYLFSHGVIGSLALLTFLAAIVWLARERASSHHDSPSARQLALLLGLPFLVTCAAALAGQYPYGGSRHEAFLLIFGVSGISLGIARIPGRMEIKVLVVVIALIVCNLFPAPPPPIRPRNQRRTLMRQAVAFLSENAAPRSIILADYQSGLLLGYYVCGHGVVEEFPPFETFMKSGCGPYTVLTSRPDVWKFYADDLPGRLATAAAANGLAPGTKVWFFNAGWISDSSPAIARDPRVGCSASRNFGENIFLCQLTVGPASLPAAAASNQAGNEKASSALAKEAGVR